MLHNKKGIITLLLVINALLFIPLYNELTIQEIQKKISEQTLKKFLDRLTRRLDPGIPGGGVTYYATQFTPVVLGEIPKVKLEAFITSEPKWTWSGLKWLWHIYLYIYDYFTHQLIYSGYFSHIDDNYYYGTVTIREFPSPFYPETHMYLEYLDAKIKFNDYTSLEVHAIEGYSATFSKFIQELKGTGHKKPQYIHFAGHGGYDRSKGAPYIKVRDDSNPSNYKNMYPSDIFSYIKENELSDINLIYLDACYTANNRNDGNDKNDFPHVLINYGGAKHMIGVQDQVDSRVAALFSMNFYKHHIINGEEYINDAFSNAKSELTNPLELISLILSIVGLALGVAEALFGIALSSAALVVGVIALAIGLTAAYLSWQLSHIVLLG